MRSPALTRSVLLHELERDDRVSEIEVQYEYAPRTRSDPGVMLIDEISPEPCPPLSERERMAVEDAIREQELGI